MQADLQLQGSQWDADKPLHILLLPTIIINSNQYRGRLDGASITRALCAGFAEATEPELCLSGSLQVTIMPTSQRCVLHAAAPKMLQLF